MRAQARNDRWVEEKILLEHEMDWTVAFFKFKANIWKSYAAISAHEGKYGHQCYAEKQIDVWNDFAADAEARFQKARSQATSLTDGGSADA